MREAEAAPTATAPPDERLRLLFDAYAAFGRDRRIAAQEERCLQAFGPPRRGSHGVLLREDAAKFESRLRGPSSAPPFRFAGHRRRGRPGPHAGEWDEWAPPLAPPSPTRAAGRRRAAAPALDLPRFAKLARERRLLESIRSEEVDTLFRLALLPGERSLDFGRFCDFLLPILAQAMAAPLGTVVEILLGDADLAPRLTLTTTPA